MRFIFLFSLIVFAACHPSPGIKIKGFDFYPPMKDSLAKASFLKERMADAKLFNLSLIINGVDSFEMRIWPWDVFISNHEVFVFTSGHSGWNGFHYHSYTELITTPAGVSARHSDNFNVGENVFLSKRLAPACGWQKFSDSIALLKLDSLPAQELIRGFKRGHYVDGGGYIIEISRPASYRFLKYWLPEENCKECNIIMALIDLIKRESGDDFCWPYCEVKR